MINSNDYISLLFSIIISTVFAFSDKKWKKSNFLVLPLILIIILTIIYKLDIITLHIASLFSNYTLFPFNDSLLTESKFNKLFSIIVVSLFIHLLICYFLISKCKIEGEFLNVNFDIKYLSISIFLSFFITIYLHIFLSYLIMNKLYILINNENIIAFVYGCLLYVIMAFESWVLFRINLYLSFKKSKTK